MGRRSSKGNCITTRWENLPHMLLQMIVELMIICKQEGTCSISGGQQEHIPINPGTLIYDKLLGLSAEIRTNACTLVPLCLKPLMKRGTIRDTERSERRPQAQPCCMQGVWSDLDANGFKVLVRDREQAAQPLFYGMADPIACCCPHQWNIER